MFWPGVPHFLQGAVTYMLPVKAFATGIKIVDQQNCA